MTTPCAERLEETWLVARGSCRQGHHGVKGESMVFISRRQFLMEWFASLSRLVLEDAFAPFLEMMRRLKFDLSHHP